MKYINYNGMKKGVKPDNPDGTKNYNMIKMQGKNQQKYCENCGHKLESRDEIERGWCDICNLPENAEWIPKKISKIKCQKHR